MLVLAGFFNHPDICWKSNAARHASSRRLLQCLEDDLLTEVVEELIRRGAARHIVTNKQKSEGWEQPRLQ